MTTLQSEELSRRMEEGVKASIAKVLQEHKKAGRSVVIYQDGKIVYLKPEEIILDSEENKSADGR